MRISFSDGWKQRRVTEASQHPAHGEGVSYPDWYLQHWHFLPDGYLSRRSIAAYETLIPRLYNAGRERSVIGAIVRAVQAAGAREILELGCGPGHALRALARAAPSARVTGVDLSPFQLERATGGGLPANARVIHADGERVPCDSASFDAVVAIHTLGHVPRMVSQRMQGEAVRLLRPGGRLFVVDHRWHPRRLIAGLQTDRSEALLGGLLRLDVLAARP